MRHKPLGPPYGPPANLLCVLRAWRERGMPDRVTKEWFARIGLSENLATRNLHGLRYLRLIDERDIPTDIAEKLRLASSEAYRAILAAVLRTAYAKVWAVVDPAHESRQRIEDAFRHEAPSAQRGRMVACFLGLCIEAGLLPPALHVRSGRSSRVGDPRHSTAPTAMRSAPGRLLSDLAASNPLELLFAKFPGFDPAWPDEVKIKWFDAFARLLANVSER